MLVYAPQIDWVFSADEQEFQGHFFSISMKNDFCFLMGLLLFYQSLLVVFFFFFFYFIIWERERERENTYFILESNLSDYGSNFMCHVTQEHRFTSSLIASLMCILMYFSIDILMLLIISICEHRMVFHIFLSFVNFFSCLF